MKLLDGTPVTPAVSGLQISTIRGGEVFENFAFGIVSTAQGPVPLDVEHKIRVASVSKIAVAIAILMLVEEQHFSLDDDVSALLGWKLRNPNFPKTPITVRSLLSTRRPFGTALVISLKLEKDKSVISSIPALSFGIRAHWATEPMEGQVGISPTRI